MTKGVVAGNIGKGSSMIDEIFVYLTLGVSASV